MKVILAMKGKRPESIQGNLLLGFLFGADVRFFDVERKELPSIMEEIKREQESEEHRAYVIARGGASAHGVLGYTNAVFEIKTQLGDKAEKLDYIVFATGTGATQAGLLLGTKLANLRAKVVGVSAGRSDAEISADVKRLVADASSLLDVSVRLSPDEIIVNDSFTCGGYGVVTNEVTDLMETVAERRFASGPGLYGQGDVGLSWFGWARIFPEGEPCFIHTHGGLAHYFQPLAAALLVPSEFFSAEASSINHVLCCPSPVAVRDHCDCYCSCCHCDCG